MRISNVGQYLGGTNNVKALEYIVGEERVFSGVIQDNDGTPINITSYTISANVEFYTATVTVTTTGRGDTATQSIAITSLVQESAVSDKTLTVNKTNSAQGMFDVIVPGNFYEGDTVADAQTDVKIGAIWMYYDDDNMTKRSSRILVIVRHGVPTVT